MANIKIYKSCILHFFRQISQVPRYSHLKYLSLRKIGTNIHTLIHDTIHKTYTIHTQYKYTIHTHIYNEIDKAMSIGDEICLKMNNNKNIYCEFVSIKLKNVEISVCLSLLVYLTLAKSQRWMPVDNHRLLQVSDKRNEIDRSMLSRFLFLRFSHRLCFWHKWILLDFKKILNVASTWVTVLWIE